MVRAIDISAASTGSAERYAASNPAAGGVVEPALAAAPRESSFRLGIEFNPGIREPVMASTTAAQAQGEPMLQVMQQWTQFMTGMMQAMFGLVTRLIELVAKPQATQPASSSTPSTQPPATTSQPQPTPTAPTASAPTTPTTTTTTPTSTAPTAPRVVNEVGSGFIWRSSSRRDKKLVVALPPGFRRNVASVRVVGPDQRAELARSVSSETASNGRVRFRFDKPGAEFPAGSMVEVTMKSGEKKLVSIHHTGGEVRL